MSVHKEHMPSDVELHYKTISYVHKNTNNKDICNTNNKLFMILYNCNFMMYCMWFHTGFLFGGWGDGAPSVLRQVRHLLLHHWKTLLLLPHLRPLHNRVGDCIHIWS